MTPLLAQISIETVTIPIIFFVTSMVGVVSIAWGAFRVLSGIRDQISSLGEKVMKELNEVRVEIAREHPTKADHEKVETRLGRVENRVSRIEGSRNPDA